MHGAPGLPPPLHASLCAGLMQDLAGGVCHLQTHPAMGLHGGHGRARADPHMPGTRWHSKTPPQGRTTRVCAVAVITSQLRLIYLGGWPHVGVTFPRLLWCV